MKFDKFKVKGPILIYPDRFGDERGFFAETYSRIKYANIGIDYEFVQDNHSLSSNLGTLRGLHYQSPPFAQGKLVRCGRGSIYDVVVDIRRGSPTYGEWEGCELSFHNGHQLYVPVGFAHGFLTLEKNSEIVYKCTEYYEPESEGSVCWNSCGIDWPLKSDPIVSTKDTISPMLKNLYSPFIYGENS